MGGIKDFNIYLNHIFMFDKWCVQYGCGDL